MFSKRLWLIVMAATQTTLLLMLSPIALADSPNGDTAEPLVIIPGLDWEDSGYGEPDGNGDIPGWPEVGDDPSECQLRAHYVHDSQHFDRPGDDRMSGEIRSTCVLPVEEMYHWAQLIEKNAKGKWQITGVWDDVYGTKTKKASAFSHDQCRPVPHGISVYGDGWIVYDGVAYDANVYVTSVPQINPCGT